jgi:glycosyltransferase involved in cell wall biosynthesis
VKPSADEPVRVLLACDRLGHDQGGLHGAGRCMIEWSRGLLERGVDVTPVILRAPPSLESVAEREHLPFVFLQRSSFDPRTISDFVALIRRRKIQVLHLQGHGSSMFGRLAARLTGLPVIIHVHADYRMSPKGYPWYVGLADRALAPRTALALAVADTLIPFMTRHLGFRQSQVQTLRNPVDLERFCPPTQAQRNEARDAIGLPRSSRVAIALGRLDRPKGIDILLEGWRTISERDGASVLLVVGEGPERSTLERWARSHSLANVRFLGQRNDVRDLLWAADLAVMPSRHEAMPMAALEALACGVPLVGSRVGGIAEIIREGENGLLVPVGDVRSLAHAIEAVLSDESRRHSLSTGASRLIEPYGLVRFAASLERTYRDVIAGGDAALPRAKSSHVPDVA